MEISSDIIKVKPKTGFLSPTELIQLRNVEFVAPSVGLKRATPGNTEEERQELTALYEQLQKQLSMPRIERLSGRAVAAWDPSVEAVRVIRKDGKFETFGYSVDGKDYLEYYEAMFLLEVNRLQLEYNSRILSIEQAYLLLMGEEKSKKFNEYLVYSHLTRVGYILVKHENRHFQKHQIDSAEDCVWAILDAELQGENIPDYVRKCQFYAKTQKQYNQIRNNIINQKHKEQQQDKAKDKDTEVEGDNTVTHDIDLNFGKKIKPNLKRKAEEDNHNDWQRAKRRRNYATNLFQRSLVDFLKDEIEYKKFRKQFEKFDIVPLRMYDEADDDQAEDEENITLTINFDVYLHNEGFRKSSPHMPNFRVIILDQNESFPTHKEIFYTHRKQLSPVPLLLVTVNDSKQIQAFLYYFS